MIDREQVLHVARLARLRLTDEDLQALERQIAARPDSGDVMRGTGGVRKVVKVFDYCKSTDELCKPPASSQPVKPASQRSGM